MLFGIAKLNEEIGEANEIASIMLLQMTFGRLAQDIGKAMAFPVGDHPDGKGEMRGRLLDEMADASAAIEYVLSQNRFTNEEINAFADRALSKREQFVRWGMTGISTMPPSAPPQSEMEGE